jgi:hypothetical protein
VTLQIVASLMSIIDYTSQAKARANETFIVQASLTIVTYDCQNIFIVKATGVTATTVEPIPQGQCHKTFLVMEQRNLKM